MNAHIYVASCGHSGSTILDIALSTHPKSLGVGEVYTFLKNAPSMDLEKHRCACSKNVFECPVWGKFLESMPVKKYIDIYDALCRITSKKIIVDSSKETIVLSALKQDRVFVLHLIRSPFGVVWSYMRKYGYTKRFLVKYAIYWNYYNFKIWVRGRKFSKYKILRYEDFALNPVFWLKKVFQYVGMSYESTFYKDLYKKSHQIGGNRIRLREIKEVVLNEEWKNNLRLSDKILIFALTLPFYLWFYKLLRW